MHMTLIRAKRREVDDRLLEKEHIILSPHVSGTDQDVADKDYIQPSQEEGFLISENTSDEEANIP